MLSASSGLSIHTLTIALLALSYFLVRHSPLKGSSRIGTVSYSALLTKILAQYLIQKFLIKIGSL